MSLRALDQCAPVIDVDALDIQHNLVERYVEHARQGNVSRGEALDSRVTGT